jgi:hypothetical protein
MSGEAEAAYGPRRAAYDLKKLRGKGMLHKIGSSGRYETEPTGPRAIMALVVLREKVIRPLLAASQRSESQTKPNHPTPVDHPLRKSAGRHCETSLRLWGWSHKDRQSLSSFLVGPSRDSSLLAPSPFGP